MHVLTRKSYTSALDFFALPMSRVLHSSTFSAQRKRFLWDTLGCVCLKVANMTQVELRSGRVYAPTRCDPLYLKILGV